MVQKPKFYDYITQLTPKNSQEETEEMSKLFEEIKGFSKKLDIKVITAKKM